MSTSSWPRNPGDPGVTVGSIRIERVSGGPNIRILKTHSPNEEIVIERADIEDLMVALDATLQQVGMSEPTRSRLESPLLDE